MNGANALFSTLICREKEQMFLKFHIGFAGKTHLQLLEKPNFPHTINTIIFSSKE